MAIRAPFRRSDDRWLGGVAAGLAHRLGIDPALIRSALILLTMAGGLGLVLYGLAWALLPDGDGEVLLFELFRGRPQSGLVGGAIMFLIGIVRPLLWFWSPYAALYGYSDSITVLWTLNVWALGLAIAATLAIVFMSRNARRRRAKMESSPAPIASSANDHVAARLAENSDTVAFPVPPPADATPLTAPIHRETTAVLPVDATIEFEPTETLPGDGDATEALPIEFTETVPDGVSWASGAHAEESPDDAVSKTSWFARSEAPGKEQLPKPDSTPTRLQKPPRLRRPRAGSRHVQATLAATLLALALVAWANAEAILSFRGLAQAIGALAVIWGISTAVAAVRGRRAAGTAITATLAALVSIPALVAIAVAPPPVVAQPLLWGCPQYLDRATVTCPTASFHTPIYSSDLDLESTPTIDTGFGHARLVVDTDEPLIVHATLTSGFVNVYQLQGWTVTWSDMDYEISNHMQGFAVNRSGMDVTVKSPDAIDGVTPVVHMTTGIGEVSIEYVGADQ